LADALHVHMNVTRILAQGFLYLLNRYHSFADADSADDERSRRRIVNGAAAVDAGVLIFTSGVHDASSSRAISP